MKGSMTVEAAYIFPFSFLIIAIVCFLGIYQYNQAVLKMTGYECILRTMEERNMEEKLWKENLARRAEQEGKDRVFGVQKLEVSLNMTASKILLSYSGEQTVFHLPFDVTVSYERMHPEKIIRFTEGIT